ncbi:MAG TPA: dihydrofolate reductase, partial [Gammaproteobacteria bacterium]|nr:dihydrofolate reductase [Gammaproteobacteria bacterium]
MISLVAAMSQNRVIGVNNKLPWNIPEELQHFKHLTMGKPMIMGRKTFDSIGRRLLPGRKTIVL